MMTVQARTVFLKIVAMSFAIYGVLWGLAPFASVNLPARLILDISDWPLDKYSEPLTPHVAWLSSISGGLLIAFSIMLWGVVAPAIKNKDLAVLRTTQLSIIAWYLVDNIGSVGAGVTSNVFFNTIYLFLVMAPISCLGAKAKK